ncbi:formylglycine-generating enzyme family protein [Cellulomonas humilata]|uniref:Formylglycine-generating enzyme required for sulfatase activity n=1 Tax=Cellulomonas humilata TaxID=144055 RepID=A0ABU0EDG5_9CELL|nr:SUMF1/EgtB/PvdO family nonheme iron enzyme [Cellulomonas humilata]MDQ0373101.1 formylglycine-generating enzyme required for sulfatase activity [Cellulomonas humilata]
MPGSRVDLVPVPGGTILLRDARTGSSREVRLRPFTLAVTPVTVEGGDDPMHPVTWFDAVRWCNRASLADGFVPAYVLADGDVTWHVGADGYRLPTEAEWEWACRAGTTTPTYGPLAEIAWTASDEVGGPQPVARKAANAYGLFDMLGNVWEWVWDYIDTARYADYRTLRGGGWADRPWSCRASVRRGSAPDAVLEDVGFRVARGAVGADGSDEAQGWSAAADLSRARIPRPVPFGWTPLGTSLLRRDRHEDGS